MVPLTQFADRSSRLALDLHRHWKSAAARFWCRQTRCSSGALPRTSDSFPMVTTRHQRRVLADTRQNTRLSGIGRSEKRHAPSPLVYHHRPSRSRNRFVLDQYPCYRPLRRRPATRSWRIFLLWPHRLHSHRRDHSLGLRLGSLGPQQKPTVSPRLSRLSA